MIQIPDAPWIREAETIGYPVGSDDEEDSPFFDPYWMLKEEADIEPDI